MAQWLIQQNYTAPGRIATWGSDAGAVLAAGALSRDPHLFGASVLISPILDMMNFHKFTRGIYWLTEFGDPNSPKDNELLSELDPVGTIPTTLESKPEVFMAFSKGDEVASPHHALTYAQSLATRAPNRPLWVQEWEGWGHLSSISVEENNKTQALILCFLADTLGLP